jgi:hypothetical protein
MLAPSQRTLTFATSVSATPTSEATFRGPVSSAIDRVGQDRVGTQAMSSNALSFVLHRIMGRLGPWPKLRPGLETGEL